MAFALERANRIFARAEKIQIRICCLAVFGTTRVIIYSFNTHLTAFESLLNIMDEEEQLLDSSMQDLNINNVSIATVSTENSSKNEMPSSTSADALHPLQNSPGSLHVYTARLNSRNNEKANSDSPSHNIINRGTMSPPIIQDNKRRRRQSSQDSIADTASNTANIQTNRKIIKASKRVTFDPSTLQNADNNNDAATDDEYTVIQEAAPIWKSALTHRTYENRANIRSRHLKELLDRNEAPLWCYGLDRYPDYLKPMSDAMLAIHHSNGKKILEQAYLETSSKVVTEKALAQNHESITEKLYTDLGNPDLNKCQNRAANILAGYRAQEARKMAAQKKREEEKRPSSSKDWKQALEMHTPADRSRSRSRPQPQGQSSKRRRSNSRSPAPSNSYTNFRGRRGRGRGGYRGGRSRGYQAPAPRDNKEQALLSALDAFKSALLK